MNLSVGNVLYLGLVVAGFTFFIGMLGVTAWRCNGPGAKSRQAEPLQTQGESLKVHGDKLSHAVDRAA